MLWINSVLGADGTITISVQEWYQKRGMSRVSASAIAIKRLRFRNAKQKMSRGEKILPSK